MYQDQNLPLLPKQNMRKDDLNSKSNQEEPDASNTVIQEQYIDHDFENTDHSDIKIEFLDDFIHTLHCSKKLQHFE